MTAVDHRTGHARTAAPDAGRGASINPRFKRRVPDAIPRLIAAMPAIITALVNFFIKAIPQIIEAGIKLLAPW